MEEISNQPITYGNFAPPDEDAEDTPNDLSAFKSGFDDGFFSNDELEELPDFLEFAENEGLTMGQARNLIRHRELAAEIGWGKVAYMFGVR